MPRIDIPGDLRRATALLTRLPVKAEFANESRPRWVWAFPLIGAGVSGLTVLVGLALLAIGLEAIAVPVALLVLVMLTGAMHEDGLADCADGFWGGWTRERRLEIMKDSQIGTYGVIALVLVFLMRWSLWTALLGSHPWALVAAGALSRAAMPAVMTALPHARTTGLSHHTGRPSRRAASAAAIVALAGVMGLVGVFAGALAAIVAAFSALLCGALAHRKIQGQTGDVLGATQVITEISVLATCVALFQL